MRGRDWVKAGQGWQAAESTLRLAGWSRNRRVIVMRRQIKKNLAVTRQPENGPLQLSFAELGDDITVYEWWSLFVRLANPEQHTEAITSRPLMLYAIGKQTRHAGQTRLTVSSSHAEAGKVEQCYRKMAVFFKELWSTAEQLTTPQRWCRILSLALVKYLRGRQLQLPDCLPAPA